MKHDDTRYEEIARWLEIHLDPGQRASLMRYQEWLATEAVAAGGVGPHETERLFDRHIADSLAYLRGIPRETRSILDVGGGVGLPSIPLAIALPEVAVTLVDRSARRTRLAERAGRILDLANLRVERSDVDEITESYDVVTFRASLRIEEAALVTLRRTTAGGTGLLGVSRLDEPPSVPNPPTGATFNLSSEGTGVLDSPFWLLRMQHT